MRTLSQRAINRYQNTFAQVTVTVTPIKESKLPDFTLDNPDLDQEGAISGLRCFLFERNANEVFMTYNVALQNPAMLRMKLTDALKFDQDRLQFPDAEVEVTASQTGALTGNVYRIRGRGDSGTDGLLDGHATFIIDLKTYPLGQRKDGAEVPGIPGLPCLP